MIKQRVVFISKGLNSHSKRTLNYLSNSQYLFEFYTTLVFPNNNLIRFLTRFFPKLSNQIVDQGTFDKTKRFIYIEILRRLFKFFKFHKIEDLIWELGDYLFDFWVSFKIKKETNVIFGFEHASFLTFKKAKKYSVICILEQNSVHCDFFREKIIPLVSLTCSKSEVKFLGEKYQSKKEVRRSNRRKAELELADIIICNSEYVKNSLIYGGVNAKKIFTNVISDQFYRINRTTKRKDKIVFAVSGNLTLLKGTHLVLELWMANFLDRVDLELILIGNYDLGKSRTIPFGFNIKIIPRLSHLEYLELLNSQIDVHILNTFTDSFGMTVVEALENGIFVITTKHCGAADLIINGENGVVISPGNNGELLEAINYASEMFGNKNCSKNSILHNGSKVHITDDRVDLTFESRLSSILNNL